MNTIIQKALTAEGLGTQLENYIRTGIRVQVPDSEKQSIVLILDRMRADLASVVEPYFSMKREDRFNAITDRMDLLIRKIKRTYFNPAYNHKQKKIFFNYWKELSEQMLAESIQTGDSYLRNCCTYFNYRIKSLKSK